MILPLTVELTPKNEIVKKSEVGSIGYSENIEYNIQISPNTRGICIEYYGEDDTYLEPNQIEEIVKNRLYLTDSSDIDLRKTKIMSIQGFIEYKKFELKKFRKSAGFTQNDFSQIIGVSRSIISKIESKEQALSKKIYLKIQQTFKIKNEQQNESNTLLPRDK